MSIQVENLEHNMVKLTVTVSAEDFGKALTKAYNRQKKSISVPGFRKGHVPQQLVEKMYGTGVFYEDAANILINDTYNEESQKTGLTFVSRPEFDIEQIEKGKDFIYTAEVAVKPEVTLGQYKGIEVPKADLEVTDEEIGKELASEQDKNSRLIDVDDRAVEDGDTVILDYSGSVDGVAFDGGTAENQTLVIGSNTFIPGFEDGLIGAALEEERDVAVTFPEEYHAEDLKGKAAIFKCKVHKIQKKELPELNDDFAKDVSEFDTLDEYKEDIRKTLAERKQAAAKQEKEDAAVDKLIETSEMDIPEAMIASQADQSFEDFARQIQSQGISMDLYMQYTGQDEAAVKETMKPQALKQIQTRLVLEKVAEAENIEISDERIEEEIKKMAEQYQMDFDQLNKLMGDYEKEQMKADLAVQEAITLIADAAVEV
ncbi:MAG: trigger factor [Lachnospiraceae bacterium]|nr:trigger factor [Lachnospiraceae bacterium]